MTGVSHIFFSKKTLKKGCFKELWSCFNASQLKTLHTQMIIGNQQQLKLPNHEVA